MGSPFISVLVDTFDHERFIAQALESVFAQTLPAEQFEVVVIDDGSRDATPQIARRFVRQHAPRVRYLRKENGGQASAFNAAIPECRGQIVAFLDGDDCWEPAKLATVVQAFERHPEVGAVGHGIFEVDAAGAKQYSIVPGKECSNSLRSEEEARQFVQLRCFLGTSRLAVRRETLHRVLPLPEKLFVEADEYMAALSAAADGALVLNQPLTNYRLHGANWFQANVSGAKAQRKLAALQCLAQDLPRELERFGVPHNVAAMLVEPNWLDAERLRLSTGGGWPWDTFRVERASHRLAYRGSTAGYAGFHALVLALAMLLPPQTFYRLKDWYARHELAEKRGAIGAPVPAQSLIVRKACV